jgi:DNA-directed RNA polymerase specialized sigma24 family protein
MRWVLSARALQGLLASLDADADRAADRYEELRQKLIVFFAGRSCPDADDLADETLDRLSRRISEAGDVRDVGRFAYGVARLVLSESIRRGRRRRDALRLAAAGPAPTPFETETGLDCLRECAARLPAADRELVLGYYESVGREGQAARKDLARRHGLTPAALRVRVFRIRRQLEASTRRCLAERRAATAGRSRTRGE